MEYSEFVARVEACAPGHMTEVDAGRAIDATLATLAERVSSKEAADLAAQLPKEMKAPLATAESGPFAFGEFLRRVAEREGLSPSEALHHARAVVHVLGEAVTPGEIDDVRAELPEDFEPLFHRLAATE